MLLAKAVFLTTSLVEHSFVQKWREIKSTSNKMRVYFSTFQAVLGAYVTLPFTMQAVKVMNGGHQFTGKRNIYTDSLFFL